MTIALTIIIGIVTLSVILIIHELGHFVTAKASGVRVEEFGLGFPPRLFGVRWGETLYSLNAIPFGGFNRVTGEENPEEARSLASKSTGIRLLFFSAGSLMNFLLPLLLFSIVFMIPHDMVTEPVMVEKVAPNSPAAVAGIRPGDAILSANEKAVNNRGDLSRCIQLNLGKEITLLVQHSDSTTGEVQVVPRWNPPEGEGAVGIAFDLEAAELNQTIVSQSYPFWKAIPMGASACIETVVIYKDGIISVITGKAPMVMAGPVGIAQLMGEVAMKAGISPLLEFAAFISLILGICMLFPLPALDGGRIAFILLEWVRRGKRVSPRTEGLVHFIGFVMFMLLLVAISYQDIIRIISGESLIP